MPKKQILATACFFFFSAWLLLSATSAGHLFVADEFCYYQMAASFADHGRFDIPSPHSNVNVRQAKLGRDGRFYAPYSFGQAFYLLPWAYVARGFQGVLGTRWAPTFAFSFAHSLTTALTWTVFLLILLSYGLGVRRAVIFAAASLAATLAFPYARSLFAEPTLGLFLAISWLGFRQRGRWSLLFSILAGLSLSFAITVRPSAAVFLPGFWLLAWQQTESQGHRVWKLALAGGLSLSGVVLLGLFNYARFGEFWTSGYPPLSTGNYPGFDGKLWVGLAIFLLSPGKALWLFNPLIVLSALGWKKLWSAERMTALFVAWLFLVNLGLHSIWIQPEGGTCWGPRFFVPLLPMLLLPAALFWSTDRSRSARVGMIMLTGLGLVVQVLGVAVNYSSVIVFESMVPAWASKGVYYSAPYVYNLRFSPFPAHLAQLGEIVSAGSPLLPRSEALQQGADRSETHSFPYWSDTIDVWAIHLVKDGYSATRVLGVEALLIALGVLFAFLAYREARRGSASLTRNDSQPVALCGSCNHR